MTTLEQVRTAWDTAVWQHESIQAITDKILTADLNLSAMREVTAMSFQQKINAFMCLVSVSDELRIMQQRRRTFTVDARYYLEIDLRGERYNAALDAMDILLGLVRTELGGRWSNTVDYVRYQTSPIDMSRVVIAGKPCWVAKYKFLGFKNL